jgi:hydroxymethylbilane synthase
VRAIKTEGDRHLDLSLRQSGQSFDKGLFTKDLERALKADEIDVAIHSLKDLPTDLSPEFRLAAVLPRHDPADVLLSKMEGGLAGLPKQAIVGTSSPRRAAQLEFFRPDLQIVEVRGNVPTRLEKLRSQFDGLVLAKAGLERLGYDAPAVKQLDFFWTELHQFYPAVGQGAIAVEILTRREDLLPFLRDINDRATETCVLAERAFLRLLGGGCHTPVGVRTQLTGDKLTFAGLVFEADGTAHSGQVSGVFAEPEQAAQALWEKCYESKR